MARIPDDSPEYTRRFLRDVAVWSIPLAAVAAAAGSAITGDLRFAASCLLGAAIDLASLVPVLREREDDASPSGWALRAAGLVGVRIALKGVLLVCAAALPGLLSLAGMAFGVLTYDTTLITVGVAVSLVRMYRTGPSGRPAEKEGR
jgi:hypothetical protein